MEDPGSAREWLQRETEAWKRREPPAESALLPAAKIRKTVAPNVTLLRQETLAGTSYGPATFKVYDACADGQEKQDPLLIVWLHGADMGDIPAHDLAGMHKRLRRRCFFLAPLSPKASHDGLRFFWGVSYTKAQNKGGLGFVYGTPHEAYLHDMCTAIMKVKEEIRAIGVYCMGYSMGGFGVYQLAAFAPTLFDAAVAVAGYGQGTMDKKGATYNAPQPEATQIFEAWCAKNCPRLSQVGALVVVHSPTDQESSYNDARAIVDQVRREGGCVTLVTVPADMAESDPKSRKAHPSGHRYFNYALLNESSIEILYDRIEAMLAGTTLPPAPPSPTSADFGRVQAAAYGVGPASAAAAPRTVADALSAARAQEHLRPAAPALSSVQQLMARHAQERAEVQLAGTPQQPPAWFQKPVQAFRPASQWDGGSLLNAPQAGQIPTSRLEAIQAAAARFRADSARFGEPSGGSFLAGSTLGGTLL